MVSFFLFWFLFYQVFSIEYIPSDDKKTLEIKGTEEVVTSEGVSNSVDSNLLENVIIHNGIIEIGTEAFFGFKRLTQITLPLNVKYLQKSCFQNCTGLKSIELKSGLLKIYQYAFMDCVSLESISLPSSLQYINNEAFTSCISIAHYYVTEGEFYSSSEDNTILILNKTKAYSGPGAYSVVKIPDNIEVLCKYFLNCFKNVTQIEFNSTGNLKRIEGYSLSQTSISNIEYPHGVTFIGSDVLFSNTVEYVKIPSTLKSFETGLFSPTPNEVFVEPGCEALKKKDGIIFNTDMNEILFMSASKKNYNIPITVTKIDPTAIRGAKELSTLTNESSHSKYSTYKNLLYDANQAKLYCCPGGVHQVIVSEKCVTICELAFKGLTISSIVFEGEKVRTISGNAFHSVKTLKKIVLPNGLESIDSWATSRSDIEEIIFPSSLIKINSNGLWRSNIIKANFSNCTLLTTLKSGVLQYSEKMESVVLPPFVQKLEENAFFGCVKLKEVIFPTSVTSIGSSCFSECLSLEKISFKGENITEVGVQAFFKCNVSTIKIPNSIKVLKRETFAENKKLISVNISEDSGIEEIQMGVFRGCENIGRLEFGKNLKQIPPGCFYEMKSLKWIEISQNNPTYESYEGVVYLKGFKSLIAFPNGGTTYQIHNLVQRFGDSAFFKCEQLETVNTYNGSNLENIESKTFLGCILLSSIEIPSNVKNISGLAFSGCISLETVKFRKGCKIESIESDTFKDCNHLREVIFEEVYYDEIFGYFKDIKEFQIKPNVYQKINDNGNNFESSKLKEIKSGAFEGFENLERLDLPRSVKIIGNRAFAGCSRLKGISIFNVEHIGEGAFSRCSSLKYLHFGENITLNDETFYGCEGLIQITYCGIKEVISDSFSNKLLKVSVQIGYPHEEFGGLKVTKILDDSCNFPSGKFTISKNSTMNNLLLSILIEEGTNTERD